MDGRGIAAVAVVAPMVIAVTTAYDFRSNTGTITGSWAETKNACGDESAGLPLNQADGTRLYEAGTQ